MRMSMKIAVSIVVLMALAAAIFLVSLFSLRRVNNIVNQVARVSAPKVVACADIESLLRASELGQRNILLVGDAERRKGIAASLNDIDSRLRARLADLERLESGGQKEQIADIAKAWSELDAVNEQIAAKALLNTHTQAKELSLNESYAAFTACVAALDEIAALLTKSTAFAARPALERVNIVRSMLYRLRNYEKDAVLEVDQAKLDAVLRKAAEQADQLGPEVEFIARGNRLPSAIRAKCVEFGRLYAAARENIDRVLELAGKNEDEKAFILAETIGREKSASATAALGAISAAAIKDFETQTVQSAEVYRSSVLIQVVVSVVGLAAALALAVVIIGSITRSLNLVIGDLNASSNEVNEAARVIADSSGGLAEGARHQAEQLQDTSSTLNELASTTRQNADNAARSNVATSATVKLVVTGAEAVKDMSAAMEDISSHSEKISAIIKTIEEIAFQTNLLALNAAVEASRAGEAGKGFAVVADEVRNLAQRSAQSARDTSELIKGTVDKVRNGSEIANRLASSFREIENGTAEFQDIIREIAEASGEQAHAVEQVNANVAQLDRSTQQNAVHAEESTRVSRDLNDQARNLTSVVEALSRLVTGGAGGVRPPAPSPRPPSRPRQRSLPPPPRREPFRRSATALPPAAKPANGDGRTMTPNDIIPLDEDF